MKAALGLAVALVLILPSSAFGNTQVLQRGSRGPAVARWQQILNDFIGASGPRVPKPLVLDGVFGPKTAAVERWYEHGNRLEVDGIVGGSERSLWVGSWAAGLAPPPDVGPGTVSAFVGRWQQDLNRWLRKTHRPELLVDGIFGARTEAATRAFQRANRLAVDGVVGRKTWGYS